MMENQEQREIKVDRRIRKTKKAIKTALMTLATDKNINEITVTDLSELADINRKTFYVYYKDLYDVIDDIENDIIEKLLQVISKKDITKIIMDPYQMLHFLTDIINKDIDFYALFLNSTAIDTMLEKVKAVIRDNALEAMKDETTVSPEMLRFIFEYIAGGLITSFKEWFRSEQTITLEDLSAQITVIISAGLKPIIK